MHSEQMRWLGRFEEPGVSCQLGHSIEKQNSHTYNARSSSTPSTTSRHHEKFFCCHSVLRVQDHSALLWSSSQNFPRLAYIIHIHQRDFSNFALKKFSSANFPNFYNQDTYSLSSGLFHSRTSDHLLVPRVNLHGLFSLALPSLFSLRVSCQIASGYITSLAAYLLACCFNGRAETHCRGGVFGLRSRCCSQEAFSAYVEVAVKSKMICAARLRCAGTAVFSSCLRQLLLKQQPLLLALSNVLFFSSVRPLMLTLLCLHRCSHTRLIFKIKISHYK